jgi:hypothetical protein
MQVAPDTNQSMAIKAHNAVARLVVWRAATIRQVGTWFATIRAALNSFAQR